MSASFTSYAYSSRCHLDRTIYPGGAVTEYAYDCDGNLEKVWDANHPKASNPSPTQTYAYDLLNRLSSVLQPWTAAVGGNAVTSYGYDVQDHLNKVTDAEGNVTTYAYGDRDLMTSQVSPASGTTTYAYNEHAELTSQIDARGIAMSRTVDALDRATAVIYPTPDLDVAYTYDDPAVAFSKGRLTRITRGTATIASIIDYRYDRFGRLIQDGELAYAYDANGNPTSLVYPGGVTAVTTYDFADRAGKPAGAARRQARPAAGLLRELPTLWPARQPHPRQRSHRGARFHAAVLPLRDHPGEPEQPPELDLRDGQRRQHLLDRRPPQPRSQPDLRLPGRSILPHPR